MKRHKILGVLVLMIVLVSFASKVLAVSTPNITTKVTIVAPTTLKMYVKYWKNPDASFGTVSGATPIVNFSADTDAGSVVPGATSWQDSDTWTSRNTNVGFSVLILHPGDAIHNLTIACGQLYKSDNTFTIPYQSAANPITGVTTPFFGFSAVKDWTTYIAGTPAAMQIHSMAGFSIPVPRNEPAHIIDIYNQLMIPPNAPAGEYQTTDAGTHLVVTWI